jgi:membrane protein implicated in regulation of membrane protease activity
MKHLITLAFLVAAIAAYLASAGPGVVGALFIVVLLFEAVLWWRVLRQERRWLRGRDDAGSHH